MTRISRILAPALVALASLTAACGGENPYQAAKSAETAPANTDAASGDGIADNEFIPEGQNLSDCVGTVERPDCGTKSKGGLHMWLVFAAIILGLGVVGWRLSVSIRRRDAVVNVAPADDNGWSKQV